MLSRTRGRDQFRQRRHVAVEELIGHLIRHHGLTDEVRARSVCLFWTEIAGDRVASKTFPVSLKDGVLRVEVSTSSWLHELQFSKVELIATINDWIGANQVWLGPPPLVVELRFALAMRRRGPLVDREHARRLRLSRRLRPRVEPPSIVSETEREAIREATSSIGDPELRALIEGVRLKWNR
ncbi:MAG: DUF721 domain-containing protein [Deltaproteobacteria bacterium]|nr:DUF721 domain-containing protein [Deltaproteobacteria bacterium]